MQKIRQLRYLAAALIAAALLPGAACAQEYPAKSIRLTIPFPPGGASDILARAIADRLTETFKQRVIVDNRPGGGGLIAIDLVARAPADGYSLLQIATSFVINPSLYRKLSYNARTDFSPVSILAVADNIVVAHPSLPARSARELISLAKSRPGQLNYAHTGYGTQAFLAAELFKQTVSANLVPVPYKGTPAALIDVITGQVHVMFAGAPPALPHIQSGKLRAIAVTGKERLPQLPAVPALSETLSGFEASVWYGILTPAGTPRDVVARLNAELNRILQLPAITDLLTKNGFRSLRSTPEEFSAFMVAEGEKWARVIKRSGVTVAD